MKRVLLSMIQWYQRQVSPSLPCACRFIPTCSQYAYEAIDRYGIFKGGFLATKRLLRCNPLFQGGYDPVP